MKTALGSSDLMYVTTLFWHQPLCCCHHNTVLFHLFTGDKQRIQLPLIKIAGEDIEFVDNFNFLGIIINKHLNWTSHVDMLSAKLSKTIGILNTLKHVLPINIMRTLYTSLILCHLKGNCIEFLHHVALRFEH